MASHNIDGQRELGISLHPKLPTTQKDNKNEVLDSLKKGQSGLKHNQEYIDHGMRCHVSGQVNPDLDQIDRKMMRFMSETSAYSFLATKEAIEDSGLSDEDLSLIHI